MRVYLDVCCLNRPFDDQSQMRIHLESEAVLAILALPDSEAEFLRSPAHDLESGQNPDLDRRERVQLWLDRFEIGSVDHATATARIQELMDLGFKNFDAYHLACAEQMLAEVFATCDDRLLACAKRNESNLHVRVVGLLELAGEIIT